MSTKMDKISDDKRLIVFACCLQEWVMGVMLLFRQKNYNLLPPKVAEIKVFNVCFGEIIVFFQIVHFRRFYFKRDKVRKKKKNWSRIPQSDC